MQASRRSALPLAPRLLLALAVLAVSCVAPRASRGEITADEFLTDVKYLADDRLEGRLTGTEGCEEAARYVADRFHDLGLAPGGDFGTYYQHFDAVFGRRVDPTTAAKVGERELKRDSEFSVVHGVGSAAAEGGLFFVGYGLESKAADRHDYAGLDVKGKIAVALMGAPGLSEGKGDFLDTKPGAAAARAHGKLQAAFQAQAAGLILINDPAEAAKGKDALPEWNEDTGDGVTFPAIHVTAAVGREILKAGGIDLDEAVRKLETGASAAAPLAGESATVRVDTSKVNRPTANVVGVLKGDGSHPDEHLIVGAHYDHLGWGTGGSLAPGVHAIHNGADDNASGTSAMMAIAKWCATAPKPPPRTIVFLAFSGEELGLLGSAYYTKHPLYPLAQCDAMLNLDMVGRSRNGYCAVGAIGSAAEFKSLAEKENDAHQLGLKLELSDGGMAQGSSDHQSFLNEGVPSLFFFSGLHEDYHKPSDDAAKINADGGARIAKLCAGILDDLEHAAGKPVFVKAAPQPSNPHAQAVSAPSAEGRPWFGSIPAFGATGDGVLFDGVSPGSPAEKAGLKKGDRLVGWNGREIKTLEDFSLVLNASQIGDVVHATLLRDGRKLEVDITLALHP